MHQNWICDRIEPVTGQLSKGERFGILSIPAGGRAESITAHQEQRMKSYRTVMICLPLEIMWKDCFDIIYKVEKSHNVRYIVCAVVSVPYSMSFRYSGLSSMGAVINPERLRTDSSDRIFPMFYMFDAPERSAEDGDEAFLKKLTDSPSSTLMYESKATVRAEFEGFRSMFTLLGGVLCVITGLVGILNFFNSIMTGIISRRREFAVLQSIGMTGRQLKSMLIYEGLLYAAGAILLSVVLSIIIEPLAGRLMENVFWFYSYSFTLKGIFITAPVFLAAGAALPALLYIGISRRSIIERLRE